MNSTMKLLIPISLMAIITFLPLLSGAVVSCGGSCVTLDDCDGQLTCNNGKCGDDPDVGTRICRSHPLGRGGPSPPMTTETCRPSGTLRCGSKSFPAFQCSPPVTSSTRATLSNNDFSQGGSGGAQSECDGRFHSNSELIVALSTGWYNGGSRCGQTIRITSLKTGRTVLAKVVDECDSMNGCDAEHANQPPCKNNIVDGSDAVWKALGLSIDVGLEEITWSMA